MKTTDLFQSILLFALFLCGLTACNDSDEISFISSVQLWGESDFLFLIG